METILLYQLNRWRKGGGSKVFVVTNMSFIYVFVYCMFNCVLVVARVHLSVAPQMKSGERDSRRDACKLGLQCIVIINWIKKVIFLLRHNAMKWKEK